MLDKFWSKMKYSRPMMGYALGFSACLHINFTHALHSYQVCCHCGENHPFNIYLAPGNVPEGHCCLADPLSDGRDANNATMQDLP